MSTVGLLMRRIAEAVGLEIEQGRAMVCALELIGDVLIDRHGDRFGRGIAAESAVDRNCFAAHVALCASVRIGTTDEPNRRMLRTRTFAPDRRHFQQLILIYSSLKLRQIVVNTNYIITSIYHICGIVADDPPPCGAAPFGLRPSPTRRRDRRPPPGGAAAGSPVRRAPARRSPRRSGTSRPRRRTPGDSS